MAYTRRKFIRSTATTLGAAALLPSFKEANQPMERPNFAGKIPIKVLATNWGFEGSREDFFKKLQDDGYNGFEVWIPMDEKDRQNLVELATKYSLEYGFLAGSNAQNVDEHLAEYEKAVRIAAALKPLYVNTHAGKDYFSFEQNKKILEVGIAISKKTGVPVLCETHRGRCAFNANITHDYMTQLPNLRLTSDLSHWCVVHESLLGAYEDTVQMALIRTDHIHARVGFGEGPQVNDPRAPEWDTALKAHLRWWDKVMELKVNTGAPFMTFLTEFGPPNYMPTLPYTQQPVADQWGVNVYMMKLLRERYG
jgi:sugar phosphate isomerase/epimerase